MRSGSGLGQVPHLALRTLSNMSDLGDEVRIDDSSPEPHEASSEEEETNAEDVMMPLPLTSRFVNPLSVRQGTPRARGSTLSMLTPRSHTLSTGTPRRLLMTSQATTPVHHTPNTRPTGGVPLFLHTWPDLAH